MARFTVSVLPTSVAVLLPTLIAQRPFCSVVEAPSVAAIHTLPRRPKETAVLNARS
jgi:hypothetical protein